MSNGAWADILTSLSEKRSSIEAAALHALQTPECAPEYFAAVLARLQSTEFTKRLAPLYLVHEICQRSLPMDESATPAADQLPGHSAFIEAASLFLSQILENVLPDAAAAAAHAEQNGASGSAAAAAACAATRFATPRVHVLLSAWERKQLFPDGVLRQARAQLDAARRRSAQLDTQISSDSARGAGPGQKQKLSSSRLPLPRHIRASTSPPATDADSISVPSVSSLPASPQVPSHSDLAHPVRCSDDTYSCGVSTSTAGPTYIRSSECDMMVASNSASDCTRIPQRISQTGIPMWQIPPGPAIPSLHSCCLSQERNRVCDLTKKAQAAATFHDSTQAANIEGQGSCSLNSTGRKLDARNGAATKPSVGDPSATFMRAIEQHRAEAKRLKNEARLRPRPLSMCEEFECEWYGLPAPRQGDIFLLQVRATPAQFFGYIPLLCTLGTRK